MRKRLQILALSAFLSGCSMSGWVSAVHPDATQPACGSQGTTGVWQTPDGDKWTIKDDCSGGEVKCGYEFDFFFVVDGKVTINLQKASTDDACLSAPQTHECTFKLVGTNQMAIVCDLIHYTLSK